MTLSNHHPLTTPHLLGSPIYIHNHNSKFTHHTNQTSMLLSLNSFIHSNNMQQAIPYRSWHTTHFTTPHSFTTNSTINTHNSSNVSPKGQATMVRSMVLENALVVFARNGCCMSHVVKRLLLGLGVNPAVHEVEEKDEEGVVRELEAMVGANNDGVGKVQFPAVFIGGKLLGGLDRLIATHISGELVPILKQAGALWL